jgi:hypothetical protein
MPDPVVTPAPSTVTPAVTAPAPVVAPAAAAIDPAKPLEATPAVTPPADPAKPAEPAKPAIAAPVIPEKYDFTALELPKGIELNSDLVEAISPVFKKHGLTQEAANELVKAHADALAKVEATSEATREANFKEWMKTTVTNYQATLKKEWGADTDAKLAVAQAGMAKVMSPAAKALLDETGLGSHPEFVKAFYQVGLMSREDTPPAVVTPPASGKTAAQVLYGNTNPSQNH